MLALSEPSKTRPYQPPSRTGVSSLASALPLPAAAAALVAAAAGGVPTLGTSGGGGGGGASAASVSASGHHLSAEKLGKFTWYH